MTDSRSNIAKLTPELIETSAARVHTYESFGRAVIGQALRAASENRMQMGNTSMKIPAEVTIRSYTTETRDPAARSVSVDVCILSVCVHVEVE